ncbi:MAG: NTP transferase domain-containing protein [Clostridia bacterium]|nr:NTP transferase domain-containing protein [Clostridia bacterium]
MKAVVMAGGEGSRLRPLTCTRPKPMIKIMGKPVLGYIIDLLIKNGFDEIAVTTRYRSEDIENYTEDLELQDTDIYCIEEEKVLGTAGCVKNAAKKWNEPFVVISGDCICDIELSKVMLYHKSIRADATIVCSVVDDPGEYGTVNLTRNGSVDSFCEKPDWSHAASNLANTGIYVLNPSVLSLIHDDECDFANDLFPLLMNNGKRLFGYQTENYWCDIGDFESLRMCVRDIMSHKVNIELPFSKNGVFSSDGYPKGNFEIIPPVYFGRNVKIGNGSTIGPFTVIEDNVVVGDNTRIKKSVVMANSVVGGNCDVIGSVTGEMCLLKRNTVCLEGSCVGDGCIIESGSTVSNQVFVWPEKHIPYRTVLTDNLRDGKSGYDLLSSDGVCGSTFSEMSPERCCRLGEALGSSSCGGKVGIGYDSSRESKALAMAVLSGLISTGCRIFDFGESFESQMGFFVSFCSLDSGIFISADEQKTEIKLFGEYGLPLSRKHEREIESRYKRCDFRRACGDKCNEISDMSTVSQIYQGQLLAFAGENVSGECATVNSKNPMIKNIADSCFYWLGCYSKKIPEFIIGYSGKTVTAKDENGNIVMHEKLISICASDALANGQDICISFDSPAFIDNVAEKNNRKVYRVGKSPMVRFDYNHALISRRNLWAYDGLSLVFNIIKLMKKQNKKLFELVNDLPEFNIASKTVLCNIALPRLAGILEMTVNNETHGLRKALANGYVTVTKTGAGRHLRIVAEAESIEAANEICIETQNKINSDTIDNIK